LKQNNFKDKAYWIFIFVLKAKMAKWSQKVHQRSTSQSEHAEGKTTQMNLLGPTTLSDFSRRQLDSRPIFH